MIVVAVFGFGAAFAPNLVISAAAAATAVATLTLTATSGTATAAADPTALTTIIAYLLTYAAVRMLIVRVQPARR